MCYDALAEDPAQRPTARALADRVQAYLDGDRDLERRRALAVTQLAAAREALGSDRPDARSLAMQAAGRALALDPGIAARPPRWSPSLILDLPKQLPPSLVDSLDQADRTFNSERAKVAMWSLGSLFLFAPLIPFVGIRSWAMVGCFYALIAVDLLVTWEVYRSGRTRLAVTVVVMTATLLLFTRVMGPFIVTPIVACAILVSLSAVPKLTMHARPVIAIAALALMLPFVLEWTGVLPATYSAGNGYVISSSDMLVMRGRVIDHAALIFSNITFVLITAWIAFAISRRRRDAQRQLHIREWHLRQLLPTDAKRPWSTQT